MGRPHVTVGAGATAPRLSERACQGFVWSFAGWTLCANLVVALGGSLRQLVALAAAVAVSVACASIVRRRRPGRPAACPDRDPPRAHPLRGEPYRRLGIAVASLVLVGSFVATDNLLALWLGAVALLGTALALELRARPEPPPAGRPRDHELLLLGLAVLCAAVTLVAHRPDADDAWLLNLSVAAADEPTLELLSRDSLHGLAGDPAGLPAGLPTYRLHAIELLAAAIAWLTPLRAIDAAHLLLPALVAMLVPLAYAQLLRRVIPERWIWGVALALAFLLGAGTRHMAYGNLAFVRLHQGKAVVLCVALPLVAAYALEFARSPRPRSFARLAAAQIAALGLSASALWIAPAVSGLALACATPLRRRGLRTLATGLLASFYPLAAGLALVGATRTALAEHALRQDPDGLVRHALGVVLGGGPEAVLALCVLVGSTAVARGGLERRFAAIFPLGFLLLFWNPLTAPWIAERLTGVPTYWRVFWVLPLPALMGIALSAPLLYAPRRLGTAIVLLLGTALLLLPARSTLSPQNRVRLGTPGLKVPRDVFAAAQALAHHAGPDARVVAPYRVATWLSTLHRAPVPLAVRSDYLLGLKERLGAPEVARRAALVKLVSGDASERIPTSVLARSIQDDELAAVCLAEAATPQVRRTLEATGFVLAEGIGGYEIWVRASAPAAPLGSQDSEPSSSSGSSSRATEFMQ